MTLADRIEGLDGPSREVDAEICRAACRAVLNLRVISPANELMSLGMERRGASRIYSIE
jgi:hypothetical protein